MDRAVLAALLTALLVLSTGPVAAHGNHIEADPQRSADGTVVVETVLPLVDGFVVLHRQADGGGPGEPIGHTRVSAENGFQRGVRVQMDADAWANWGANGTVWITYHEDNGAQTFDPGEDEVLYVFGSLTGTSIQLERADHEASVLAEQSRPQRTENSTATLGRVALGTDGYAVLRTERGTDGRVVGVTPLDAGVHENVTVEFDQSAFPENGSTVGLYAQLYAETGDSGFSEADRLVRAGGDPVGSYFLVRRVNSTNDASPVVQTPGSTPDDVVTPATGAPSATTDPPSTGTGPTTTGPAGSETGLGVSGFGFAQAAVAALAAAVLLARR